MTVQKVATPQLATKDNAEDGFELADGAGVHGYSGESGFDGVLKTRRPVQQPLKPVEAPQYQTSSQKFSFGGFLGQGLMNGLFTGIGNSLLGGASSLFGNVFGGLGDKLSSLFGGMSNPLGNLFSGTNSFFNTNSFKSWGPLNNVFGKDSSFATFIGKKAVDLTKDVAKKTIDAVSGGDSALTGGSGFGGMSKETEKKFWNLYFMKNILNGSKEAGKKQEEAMKQELKNMGVNVPEKTGAPDMPTIWDFWAYSEALKAGVPPLLAKKMMLGVNVDAKELAAETKKYKAAGGAATEEAKATEASTQTAKASTPDAKANSSEFV